MKSDFDENLRKQMMKAIRAARISVHTTPLLCELDGYEPGMVFWRWLAPGEEGRFENKSFAESWPDIPTSIADIVDQALVDWIGGIPTPEIVEKITEAVSLVQEIIDKKASLSVLPEEIEAVSNAEMLLESLNRLRKSVGDLSSRSRVLSAIGLLRDQLYPQISNSSPNDRPLGRG